MKAPQKRTTPYLLDDNDHKHKNNGHHDRVRIVADDDGISVQLGTKATVHKYSYNGPTLGPEGIRHLRDICDAWLEHYED